MAFSNHRTRKSFLQVFSLVVWLTVSAVFILYALYSYQLQRDNMVREITGQAEESSVRLSRIVAPYVDAYEVNAYDEIIQTEIETENHYALSAIVIHDYKMGKITGTEYHVTGRVRDARGNSRVFQPETQNDQQILKNNFAHNISEILSRSGEVIGRVFVYVNDHSLKEKLNDLLLRTTVTTVLLLSLLAILLVFFFKRLLVKPLKNLTQALSHRDKDGIPRSAIPGSNYHELAVLSETVNDMLTVIASAHDKVRKEHQRLENVISGTRAGTWYWNVQTGETEFNPRWAEMLGYSLKELSPISIDTWLKLAHPDDLEVSSQVLENYFQGRSDFYQCEVRMKHKEGHWVWVLSRGKLSTWTDHGEPLEMHGTHQDITARKRDEEQLALAASVYKQVHEGILITDDQGIIVDVNDAFSLITGYTKEESLGQPPSLLKSGRHDKQFYHDLWNSILKKGFWCGEIWNKRKNGEIFPELITISSVKSELSGQEHYVALFSDITSLKDHEQQLEHIAHYDTLTGLPNRLLFRDRLRLAMSRATRHEQPLALLFLDLDGFKAVNDTYGHNIGDNLLITLAERISRLLREEDTLARLGGDEFVIILPETSDQDSLITILKRILTSVADIIRVDNLQLRVSASIGVALYPDYGHEDVDADQLIRQADQAMYQAKLAGKNCFKFFDPEHDRAIRGFNETISSLQTALKANQFELYYQPKVNLKTHEVIGAEGLIRWHHPQDGILAPMAFLPDIEGHTLMVAIGEWTIEQSLIQMQAWNQQDITLPVSINIAAIHIQQKNFMQRLTELLQKYPQVDPKNLQLEILETSALENIEQAQTIIQQCNALGITFAIDDFGTGYSTLSYLKYLPAETLKIDQSFIRHINDAEDDRLILQAVVKLAKAFKKKIIAEGLEDLSYADFLLDTGCEEAQGYGIACPMPASEIPEWLNRWNTSISESNNHSED